MIYNFQNPLPVGTLLQGNSYRYEIVKVLGQGSFGITYLASVKMVGELGTIDAYVALKEFFMSEINGREKTKVITSQKDGLFDKYKVKFIKEAKSLARLEHPNIVKVLESFEGNNTVYYVMNFLDGGSLDEYIRQKGRIPEEETLKIATRILEALSYMHSKHMLHLDLKPSNIMMCKDKPILIDFGLSKQYDLNGDPESSTSIGKGTLGYSPIEQINYDGDSDKFDSLPITIDLYAFGATIFKMLSGKRPPMASDILNYGFPENELISLNVSPQTIRLVKSLMEPLWKNRPQTDSQVLSEISAILAEIKDRSISEPIELIELEEVNDSDEGNKNHNQDTNKHQRPIISRKNKRLKKQYLIWPMVIILLLGSVVTYTYLVNIWPFLPPSVDLYEYTSNPLTSESNAIKRMTYKFAEPRYEISSLDNYIELLSDDDISIISLDESAFEIISQQKKRLLVKSIDKGSLKVGVKDITLNIYNPFVREDSDIGAVGNQDIPQNNLIEILPQDDEVSVNESKLVASQADEWMRKIRSGKIEFNEIDVCLNWAIEHPEAPNASILKEYCVVLNKVKAFLLKDKSNEGFYKVMNEAKKLNQECGSGSMDLKPYRLVLQKYFYINPKESQEDALKRIDRYIYENPVTYSFN